MDLRWLSQSKSPSSTWSHSHTAVQSHSLQLHRPGQALVAKPPSPHRAHMNILAAHSMGLVDPCEGGRYMPTNGHAPYHACTPCVHVPYCSAAVPHASTGHACECWHSSRLPCISELYIRAVYHYTSLGNIKTPFPASATTKAPWHLAPWHHGTMAPWHHGTWHRSGPLHATPYA
jgi:hypothetical protein